jgi:hypothetical protein
MVRAFNDLMGQVDSVDSGDLTLRPPSTGNGLASEAAALSCPVRAFVAVPCIPNLKLPLEGDRRPFPASDTLGCTEIREMSLQLALKLWF